MLVLKRLFHWGPILSMLITSAVTFAMMSIETKPVWMYAFLLTTCFALHNMWCATFLGPGHKDAPKPQDDDNPSNNSQRARCQNRFCRSCDKFILNKHHHCYMINNCVGENNEQYFIRFLILVIIAALQSTTHLTLDTLESDLVIIFNIVSIGLSVGVLITAALLLYTH